MTITLPFTDQTPVKDIVTLFPYSADYFKKNRIDFCCGGHEPLAESALSKGLNIQTVLADLSFLFQSIHQNTVQDTALSALSTEEIVNHIIKRYHKPLQEELKNLSPFITKVSRKHGEHQPNLIRLHELFFQFKEEMLNHLIEEEQTVFPQMIQGETQMDTSTLINDHLKAGNLLKEMHDITFGFSVPENACNTYRMVFNRLEALESDTLSHIHLENHVLFPRFI